MSERNGYDRYLELQYRQASGWRKALFEVISLSDEDNIEKLRLGFPSSVEAYLCWTREGAEVFSKKCSQDHPLLQRLREEYNLDGV